RWRRWYVRCRAFAEVRGMIGVFSTPRRSRDSRGKSMSGRLGHGCLTSVLLVLLAVGLGGPVSGHERGRTAGDPSSCEQDTPIPLRLDQAYRRDLLPEGVLDPEDAASGFIYFKPSRPPESIYV